MRVVLSDWIVGDGQVREPVVGEVIPQRMLILIARKLASIDQDLNACPDEGDGDDEPLIGVVTWRGASANGDAAVLECGFPVRVQSDFTTQSHSPATGQRGFRGPRWWLIPVDLHVPAVGTRCAVWGEIRLAPDDKMDDAEIAPDFPDIRRDWLIREATFRVSGARSWLLELEAASAEIFPQAARSRVMSGSSRLRWRIGGRWPWRVAGRR